MAGNRVDLTGTVFGIVWRVASNSRTVLMEAQRRIGAIRRGDDNTEAFARAIETIHQEQIARAREDADGRIISPPQKRHAGTEAGPKNSLTLPDPGDFMEGGVLDQPRFCQSVLDTLADYFKPQVLTSRSEPVRRVRSILDILSRKASPSSSRR